MGILLLSMGFYISLFFLNLWCYNLLNLHIPGEVSALSFIFYFYVSLSFITADQSFIQPTAKASPPNSTSVAFAPTIQDFIILSLQHYRFVSHSFNKYYYEFVYANSNSLISVLFLLEINIPFNNVLLYKFVHAFYLMLWFMGFDMRLRDGEREK